MAKSKGWRREPARHSLARRGISTRLKRFRENNKKLIASKRASVKIPDKALKDLPTDYELVKLSEEVDDRALALEADIYQIANVLNKIGELDKITDNADMDFSHDLHEMTSAIVDIRIKDPLSDLMEDMIYVDMNLTDLTKDKIGWSPADMIDKLEKAVKKCSELAIMPVEFDFEDYP